MTDIQNILLDLLTDLDAICKKENIKYSLCLETAHSAVLQQSFYPSCCEANVAMTPDHALKFIAAVKKENRQDRIVDSMLSNPAYPDFTVRYGNPNTSMIHLPYTPSGAVPCMAVTIHMIRRKPATMNKVYRYSKAFWKACNVSPNAYPSSLKRTAIIGCHVIKKVLGASNLSRMLFKQWVSLFSANKKAKKLAIATDKYSFAADLLEAEDVCLLEGKQFPVFGYVDAYLNKAYGCSDFRKITPKYAVPSSTLLVSPYVPYQKYLDRAQELGVDFDAVRKNHAEYSKLRKQVSAYNKKIEKYYALVFRTEKRFAMYEHYMPMKKLLLKLYEQERYEELNELLHPYRSALWDCYKKGLGLCFDKEIFDITMDLLRKEGSYAYVNKLKPMVPKQHWEPMSVTDYKGNLVEFTDISELLPEYADVAEEPVL